MVLELTQTRILSALYYAHSVYFTVTIALMGFGVSGVVLSLLARNGAGPPFRWLMLLTGLFSAVTLICFGIVSRIPIWIDSAQPPFIVYLLLVIPFFCGGMAIGLLLLKYKTYVRELYAADLIASAVAATLVIFLLRPLGAPALIWGAALLSCVSLLLQMGISRQFMWQPVAFTLLIGMAALLIGGGLINYWPGHCKILGRYIDSAHKKNISKPLEVHAWTPIARIDIIPDGSGKLLTQDGAAPSGAMGPSEVEDILKNKWKNSGGTFSLPLVYEMNHNNQDALVIGTGGGRDVVIAKAFGAQNIAAVEVNAATFDFMTHHYAKFLKWPLWPEVKAYRSEGRNFVRRHPPESFDKITMSGIDTYAASNSGAYVLTENYLYTVEAMQDYLKALKSDGIMVNVRWLLFSPVARESIRISSNFLEAAKREGIKHPEQCIFVTTENVGGNSWALTFVKKTPFTQEEMRIALKNLNGTPAAAIYLPKIFSPEEQLRLENMTSTVRGNELAPVRKAYRQLINAPSEEEREAFLNNYPYDISPSYDDKPFFFQDTKWSGAKNMVHHSDGTPMQQLYNWLGLTTLVSLIGMALPLLVFNAGGLAMKGTSSLLIYFASLGLGFMMVEVGLMQRSALYLGDPMYSLVVVLGGLLFFAGIGSYLSSIVKISVEKLMRVGTFMTVVMLLAWLLIAPEIMAVTFSQPFWLRALMILVTLLPLGIAMGAPFASGLAYLEQSNPQLIPWAWGINGLTSVLASVLSVILAMNVGFTNVLLFGAAIYAVGYIAATHYSQKQMPAIAA